MNWLFTPPWSLRTIGIGMGVLVALGLWRWARERRGGRPAILRVLAIVVLLFIVLNPQALLPHERSGKPKLVVLLDTSASMATPDVEGQPRVAAALRTLTNAATVTLLNREFALDARQFDRAARPVDWAQVAPDAARGDASDLGAALMAAVAELGDVKDQAGVLLVSDGRATAPGALDAAQLALARSVPLWTWCVGGVVPRHDLWIETASSETLAFSGAEVELVATLHAAGYPNRSLRVDLLQNDRCVQSTNVVADPRPDAAGESDPTGGAARVLFRVQAPETGESRFVIRAAPDPDEADAANNERAVFLRSVGGKVRVLLAEGQPHWDTKFLVQSLKREPHVDLTAVYRLNAVRRITVVSAAGSHERTEDDRFPRTAAAMEAFDIIVLGRGAEAFFDAGTEALLTGFVDRRGGSVVFARGKPYGGRFLPLSKLEPVAWGDGVAPTVKLRATEAGRENPIFDLGAAGTLDDLLERLPALDQARVTLGEKPLAVVLASAPTAEGPVLIAYQRYGQGKALSVNASGLWRWAFRESGQSESELAYRRFWVSVLQWLLAGGQFLPGADMALTSARRYFTSDQPMQFFVATRNLDRTICQLRLAIEGGGRSVEVEPRPRGDGFVAEAGPFPPGQYRVTLRNNVGSPRELSQGVEVVSASVEKRELSADPDLMRRVAETSGGAVVQASDVARLPERLRRWEGARQLAHRQRPLWDRFWVLGGLMSVLVAEWWLRRREGLL